MSTRLRNILVSVALFVIGLMLVTSYLRSSTARMERGNSYVSVLVAAKDIPAGTAASQLEDGGYLETQRVLQRDATPQALTTITDVRKLSTSQNVYKGEQLSAFKFETSSGLNPTEQIKGTERWVSLHISPTGSVAQLVKPGDHVDIWASGKVKVAGKMAKQMLGDTGAEGAAISNDNFVTWLAVRDAVVVQTPKSLAGESGRDADEAGTKFSDEPGIWVFQVSDTAAQQLLWSQANANEDGLILALRPSDGAEETRQRPMFSPPDVN
jgi:Flp pilus assembly protein CpaB